MTDSPHLFILKRTGAVLLAAGLIDIAIMVYCIANRISYASSFNVFAVIAGVLRMRGHLAIAAATRWLAAFMLAGFAGLLVAWPLLQPISLTLTQIRLHPGSTAGVLVFIMLMLLVLCWLYRELGRPEVQQARARAGRKSINMRAPAATGVGVVVLVVVSMRLLLGGESATKAQTLAQQQLGPGYRYHVTSIDIEMNSKATSVAAVVTAWNDKEVRDLPVHWQER
jgi:flagellar biogenesis protein FliO